MTTETTNRPETHPHDGHHYLHEWDLVLRYWHTRRLRLEGKTLMAGELALELHAFRHAVHEAVAAEARSRGLVRTVAEGYDTYDGQLVSRIHRIYLAQLRPETGRTLVDHHLGACERRRVIEAIHGLSEADKAVLLPAKPDGFDGWESGKQYEHLAAAAAKFPPVVTRSLAFLGETVTLTACAPIDVSEDTKTDAPSRSTLDPDVEGADRLVLTECAITDFGVRVEALLRGFGGKRKVLSVANRLTGRQVVLTSGEHTRSARPNGTMFMYGSHFRTAWTLSVAPWPSTD